MAETEPRYPLSPHIWTSPSIRLKPDARRTVIRPFIAEYPATYAAGDGSRARSIIERLLRVDETKLDRRFKSLFSLIESRHRDSRKVLLRRFEELKEFVPVDAKPDESLKLLIGAFFSEEYSFEAAALFNPSIVRHWDQSGLEPGAIRFVMSLRGIGEGHISSVTFRTGLWFEDGRVTIDAPSIYAASPAIEPMERQQDQASLRVHFEDACDISEAVLFPMAPSQKQGIEDLRLVAFTDDNGTTSYVGTFTAYSGSSIREELLETSDFKHFAMQPLTGKVADNKGMALFPRRINGRYAMLGRQDITRISG